MVHKDPLSSTVYYCTCFKFSFPAYVFYILITDLLSNNNSFHAAYTRYWLAVHFSEKSSLLFERALLLLLMRFRF